jgi:hypothetical protein
LRVDHDHLPLMQPHRASAIRYRALPWLVLLISSLGGCGGDGWRNARNDSAGIAPDPASTREAVIQVYGAPVYGWRGLVADHTWVSVKPAGGQLYTVYQVIGWRLRRGQSVLSIEQGVPDRHWYGAAPVLYHELRGTAAEPLIERIARAADDYPHAREYSMWPGPNSNSFVQWILLEVPELAAELPWRAWGKNWMSENHAVSSTAD